MTCGRDYSTLCMEEIDVEIGGFNMEKPPNNPPNSEKLEILKKTMNSTWFALTQNGLLLVFSSLSKMVSPSLV